MKLKKLTRIMALSLALTLAAPVGVPMSQTVVAEAATVKISAQKKTLTVGKSFTLKITGTKKKVTWSTSKKSVATVSSKGKVTAKKAGTATITAKVDGKKYTCKVTVKNPVNKYVEKAPFEAKEVKLDKYTAAAPKDWNLTKTQLNGIDAYMLMPKEADLENGTSNIAVTVTASEGATQESFELLKEYLCESITKETIENIFKSSLGDSASVTEFVFDEAKINLGKATMISYTVDIEVDGVKKTLKQTIYDVFADGYTTEITVTDNGDGVTPDIHKVGEYLVNSLIFTK